MNGEERQTIEGRSLLVFDGLCGMCNGTIRFLIRRDAGRNLVYTPLEGPLGQEMLSQTGLAPEHDPGAPPRWRPDGVTLIESALTPDQRVSAKSDAIIRILHLLPGAWPWFGKLLSWVPRGLREWAYAWVARRRYRIFGVYGTCPIPSPSERALILGTAAGASH